MEWKVRETSAPSPLLQCRDSGCGLPHPIDEVLGIEPRALLMLSKYSTNSASPKSIILSFGILKVCCKGHSISVPRTRKCQLREYTLQTVVLFTHNSSRGCLHHHSCWSSIPSLSTRRWERNGAVLLVWPESDNNSGPEWSNSVGYGEVSRQEQVSVKSLPVVLGRPVLGSPHAYFPE